MTLRLSESGKSEVFEKAAHLTDWLLKTHPKLSRKSTFGATSRALKIWLFRFGDLPTSDIDIENEGATIRVSFKKGRSSSSKAFIFRKDGARLEFSRIDEAVKVDREIKAILRLQALQRLLVKGLIGI